MEAGIPLAGENWWKRRTVAVFLMMAIAGIFWIDSRYPSLVKKYRAGAQIKVAGTLSFDKLYATDAAMPYGQRVWRTSLNWLNTNKIGMTFGFFFAAAALAFLGTVSWRRARSSRANALVGAAVGMPLGVCANCVAPVGRALYASGMSTESVLAAMFSSPTLNVVVLAMSFALFPAPIALLKLATVLLLIFLVAPALATKTARPAEPLPAALFPAEETWARAFRATLVAYFKSFWHVLRVGLPLMLLAAVLGALVAEALPVGLLTGHPTVAGLLAVALVGAFLPVPMSFDVVVAYLALQHGVALPYAVVLLCTLGVYSVYSLGVVGKTISWKVAGAVYFSVAALGLAAGLLTWAVY